MDEEMVLEACEALIEKKNKLVEELYERNDQQSRLEMILLDLIKKDIPTTSVGLLKK